MDILAQDHSDDLEAQKEAEKLAKKEAKKLYQKQWREDNKDKFSEYKKKYREANKEKIAESERLYNENNKEKRAEIRRKSRQKNREKTKEYEKAYREANKEKIAKDKKLWREKNQERNKEVTKQWRENNKEKFAGMKKKWNEENREKIKQTAKIYRHSNRGVCRITYSNRQNRLTLQRDNSMTKEIVAELFQKAKLCPYCGIKMLEKSATKGELKSLDHLIPISKGGLHAVHNVVICCHRCNTKKNNKSFPEWLDRLEEPYRTKAEKLYTKQYGVSPLQGVLPLIFES